MPGLAQSLQGQDLGFYRILAEGWQLPLPAADAGQALDLIEASLPQAVLAGWPELPEDVRQAVQALASAGGRIPWTQFIRTYGELRSFGPARRDKERPDQHPASLTEQLWYRGLLGRAFFDPADGPREHAYLPDELLAVLPTANPAAAPPLGRAARPEERKALQRVNDAILDQACTLLAALRMGKSSEEISAAEDWRLSPAALESLLKAAGIIAAPGMPNPEATRAFLEAPRAEAFTQLARAWLESGEFNELRQVPTLKVEGKWENDGHTTRHKLLAFLRRIPHDQWWSIDSLVADVKDRYPDFQRPAGNFDSWYLRPIGGGDYLLGFEYWDEVDGALIRYLITGPLHHLGFVEVASPAAGQPPVAFRWSAWAEALLAGEPLSGLAKEDQPLKIDSQGKIMAPQLAPRAVRYLVARFCQWLPPQKDGYVYQIAAGSLERARKQGLEARQLLPLLQKHSAAPLPPNLLQALQRWEAQGAQVSLGTALVLRVNSAAALKALQAGRGARYLGLQLGPNAVLVKDGAGPQVLRALLELGYLGELEEEQLS